MSHDISYSRHQGNPASMDAYARSSGEHGIWRDRIYEFISGRINGVTSKEVGAHFSKPLNCISGRLTELKDSKLIRETDERRKGAQVLVAVERQGRLGL